MRAEADRAQELGRLGRDDVPGLQPAAGLGEAGGAQALLGLLRRGVVPRLAEALEVGRVGVARGDLVAARLQPRDVARRRRSGRRAARRASAPGAGCGRARRGRGSSGRRRWRRRRRPARSSSSSTRSATSASSLGRSTERTCSTIDAEPSTAITRPSGRRSISIEVTRPLPQPASSTRLVAAQLEAVEDRPRPLLVGDGDALVGGRVPVAGQRAPLASPVVTGPRSAAPGCLEGVDRARVLQRDADVVEAVQQPVLDVGLDLELEDAGRAV